MRTETITKTYAKFDELNAEQKKQVLDNMRDINVDYGWWECNEDDFKTLLGLLGYRDVKAYFSGFASQGDGASFEAVFDVPENSDELKERMKAFEEYAPLHFKDHEDIKQLYLTLDFTEENDWFSDEDDIKIEQSGRYCHQNTMSCDHYQLQEFSRYMAARYYIDLEKTYWALQEDDAVRETIEANEYEFDLDTLELS